MTATVTTLEDQVQNFPAAYDTSVRLSAAFAADTTVDHSLEWADGCYLTACHYLRTGDTARAQAAIDGANRSLVTVSERVATLQA